MRQFSDHKDLVLFVLHGYEPWAEKLRNNFFYTPHRPALQTDLDPVRVRRRLRENLFYHPFGEFTGALILLEDDEHGHTGFDRRAGLSVHDFSIAYRHTPQSSLPFRRYG